MDWSTIARRGVQLYVGLLLYGLSAALQVRSGLGLDPWDVFHQGLARHVGLAIGTVLIIVGAAVLLLWIPLRQRPGFGTVSNVVLVGLSLNWSLMLLPDRVPLGWRIAEMLGGVLLCAIATGMYIGAHLGPGPRDGLMTGFARVTGRSIRLVRTGLELTVLITGWLLGGTVGVGTVVFALTIGPLVQVFLRVFDDERAGPDCVVSRRPRRPWPASWRTGRSPSRAPDAGRRSAAADRPAIPARPARRRAGRPVLRSRGR